MMKFLSEDDIIFYIKRKLRLVAPVTVVEPMKKLPKSISYVTWSMGDCERDYCYKVTTSTSLEIVCEITLAFGLWIIRKRFYKKTMQGYERFKLE